MRCKLLENQVYIATTGEYRLCCTSREPSSGETVWTHTPQEWLQSKTVQSAINTLAKDEWPSACNRCMTEEAAGLESRRISRTQMGPGLTHLDLRFGNSCNLKCISCWSQSSSSINDEAREMQHRGIIPLHKINENSVANWYDEKFFKYFENLELTEVALAGGEPMMIKHLPEFLERLDPSVVVRITSNATIYNPKVYQLLRKFKKVIMSVSIDAVGDRIEYIRYGTNWKDVEANTLQLSEFCTLDLIPCISVLNALYYDEILEWNSKYNFKIYNTLLHYPSYLNLRNAPESLKAQLTRFEDWYKEPADVNEQKTFVNNITKLDSFRNVSIKNYLPEVASAYGIN